MEDLLLKSSMKSGSEKDANTSLSKDLPYLMKKESGVGCSIGVVLLIERLALVYLLHLVEIKINKDLNLRLAV